MITWAVSTSPSKFTWQATQKWNTPLTEPRYWFEKKNGDDLLHNILKDSLKSSHIDKTTQDELKEVAVTL